MQNIKFVILSDGKYKRITKSLDKNKEEHNLFFLFSTLNTYPWHLSVKHLGIQNDCLYMHAISSSHDIKPLEYIEGES